MLEAPRSHAGGPSFPCFAWGRAAGTFRVRIRGDRFLGLPPNPPVMVLHGRPNREIIVTNIAVFFCGLLGEAHATCCFHLAGDRPGAGRHPARIVRVRLLAARPSLQRGGRGDAGCRLPALLRGPVAKRSGRLAAWRSQAVPVRGLLGEAGPDDLADNGRPSERVRAPREAVRPARLPPVVGRGSELAEGLRSRVFRPRATGASTSHSLGTPSALIFSPNPPILGRVKPPIGWHCWLVQQCCTNSHENHCWTSQQCHPFSAGCQAHVRLPCAPVTVTSGRRHGA